MSLPFHPVPKPAPRVKAVKAKKPRTKVKERNAKRRAKELPRTYGPPGRRAFVKTLPCSACGRGGFSVNAHVVKIDAGGSRKGHYLGISPLCECWEGVGGCHQLYDDVPATFAALFPEYNAALSCEETERAYQASIGADE